MSALAQIEGKILLCRGFGAKDWNDSWTRAIATDEVNSSLKIKNINSLNSKFHCKRRLLWRFYGNIVQHIQWFQPLERKEYHNMSPTVESGGYILKKVKKKLTQELEN
ncbi:hypothetical protein [Flavobacterium sp. MDT1-60]|uniref:hypothetical protein n=1 Tax=Flavobacterium sp. MDT1-60 TaxID=1979344 RepID=UPI00177C34D4|nr:hypothetical protein [Flavobacterium sp. MDT1-60]QOG00850.1 hypothetical protein IHE43_13595 [Flavobacterium sp. MDT1-60]